MPEDKQSPYELDPQRLKQVLPEGPGVYRFKDGSGRVIYVGKAKNLKKRVLSYFKPLNLLPHKTALMMQKASGLDFILTATEKEAFILESNLIKKFIPRYNVILRDDKRYPCLRLDITEPYPRLTIVRKIKKDGALYFGPFSSANSVRRTLKVIDRVFQLRKCKGKGLPKNERPCLNFQLSLCLGPCAHPVSPEEYNELVRQVRLFLEGRNRELTEELKRAMTGAAQKMDFERAARIRDKIRAIERTVERQRMVSAHMEDQDVIGLAHRGDLFQVLILFVRKGYVVGDRHYLVKDRGGTPSEVMEAFLKQYYPRESFIPPKILISEAVEDLPAITEGLCELSGRKVTIYRPQKGEKRRLVETALANAKSLIEGQRETEGADVLAMARAMLHLKATPRTIEGIDISNLYGDMAVGTIVSFMDGLPHKAGYRNYRIRVVDGIDDYAMMAEVIERRLNKGFPPDLFLVDGGRGHLSAVKRAVERHGSHEKGPCPEVVAIAKGDGEGEQKRDKIYLPGRKNPLILSLDHPLLLLLMRIRDEAHRRAISYHRKKRGKDFTGSDLDKIPGIGAKRKAILLNHFKDINSIRRASPEALARVPGIAPSLAQSIVSFFEAANRQEAEKANQLG